MEQDELQLESEEMDCFQNGLQEIIKPYQQELGRRQKKSDFLVKCAQCVEKDDFFQLDELLRSKQASDILQDPDFEMCGPIFSQLRRFAETRVDNYLVKFKGILLQMAQKEELSLDIDFPRISVLKGIEGNVDFSNRRTTINQVTIKSIHPKRIISAAIKLKRDLYDSPFDPKIFINSLFACYKDSLKKMGLGMGDVVPIHQLYTDYVWSLQSKAFLQNLDAKKFKGCSVEQFAVYLWRFFKSDVTVADGGFRIRLNPGRGKSLWLIDQTGEKRQIVHALFSNNEGTFSYGNAQGH